MKRFLLDTHLLIWIADDSPKLPTAVRDLVVAGNRAASLCFSVASLWEIVSKNALGRPDFDVDPHSLRAGLLERGYDELPIEARDVMALAELPPMHSDPFDRILLAQSTTSKLTLVTCDRQLAQYPGNVAHYRPGP